MKYNSWKPLTLAFDKDLGSVLQQQHQAAQFIAMAGRHLIPQQVDDSNTNMQYLPENEWFAGNELPGGMRIVLYLKDLTLFIVDKEYNLRSEIPLIGKTRDQAFKQLKKNLSDLGVKVSKFIDELHYEIPSYGPDKDAAFSQGYQNHILENINYRHNAEIVLNKIAANYKNAEQVRIWPHHFDTGNIIPVAYNEDGAVSKSIGLGWAIPDDMINEPYYYLSYWSESPVEDFNEFPAPEAGEWVKSGWNGGIVRNSDILKITSSGGQQEFVEQFFNSGIKILSEFYNL